MEWTLWIETCTGRQVALWTGDALSVVREARIALANNRKLKYHFAASV